VNPNHVIIIGAGPAGIAAAIQLKRYGIEPVVLEREEVGGLLRNAYLVENYPGFPEGITGPDLVGLFKKQLRNWGIKVRFERVLELEYQDQVFFAETDREAFKATFVVIATGTKPKRISGLRTSGDIKGRTFYDICSMRGIENKRVAIIGSGDAAFDYALSLSQKNEVTIFNKSGQEKCIPVLVERCRKHGNISGLPDANVREINRNGDRLQLAYAGGDGRDEKQISFDYVVIAVGREPRLDFLGSKLEREFGKLTEAGTLYLVGDVKNEAYRQTAICAGDGIRAAMKICGKMRGEDT
jgi:thioredoxin reductase (NADPH)